MSIPESVLKSVQRFVQPHGRPSRKVPIVLLDGNGPVPFPILDTAQGKTVVIIGKDDLCGDYYD